MAVVATFSEARTRFLVERLQHQVLLGKRAESGFKAEAWEAVTSEFNENFGTQFSRQQLKNHFQGQKASYGIVSKIRSLSGFGWNPLHQIVTAEPDVWNKYLLAVPKAKQWRDKPFKLYDELHELVGGTVAKGTLRRTAKRAYTALTEEDAGLDNSDAEDAATDLPDSVSDEPKSKIARLNQSTSTSTGLTRTESVLINDAAESPIEKKDDQNDHKDPPISRDPEGTSLVKEEDPKDRKGLRTSARRSRTNGTQALAESISAAVKLEQDRVAAPSGPTVFVKEKHADMKKAIVLFMAEAKEFIHTRERMSVGVKFLRHESDAAFFITVSKDMRWDWMLSEIEQHVRMNPTQQAVLSPVFSA